MLARMMKASVGRILHYVYASHDLDSAHQDSVGKSRPAIVVQVFGEEAKCANVQVFTDGANDGHPSGIIWKTSVSISEMPTEGMLYWPKRDAE